jgi:hypothetical protein
MFFSSRGQPAWTALHALQMPGLRPAQLLLLDHPERALDTLIDLDRQQVSGRSSWQGRLWQ